MAAPPPIPCAFIDGAFRPVKGFHNVAAAHYGEGEIVALIPHEDRSMNSHRHYFAAVREAWLNLPEEDTERFATPEALRKYALVRTGYRDERTIVCASHAEALRVAAFVRPMDPYAVVTVVEAVVRCWTAQSQSIKAMGAKVFAESKNRVLDFLAAMIGVQPQALSKQGMVAWGRFPNGVNRLTLELTMPVHRNTVINMKPFHILLSDAHRVQLDAYRAKHGLKSDAAAVRHWLESLSK